MDQLDSMSEARSILDNSVAIHKSRPPLRWIANLAGSIGSSGLLEISYMEDDGYTGWRYKFNLWKWDTFWPIYDKWGTSYIFDFNIDENGVPDWKDWGLDEDREEEK